MTGGVRTPAVGMVARLAAFVALPLVLAAGAVAAPLAARSAGSVACTITYTGGYQPDPLTWEQAQNWSPARLPGASDYACIPAGFTAGTVSVGSGAKIEGVSVLDAAGLRLHNFGLELTDPAKPSVIDDVDVGSLATFTVDKGVTVTLTGRKGSAGLTGFGSAALAGAGTVEIANGATFGFGSGIQGSLTVRVDPGAVVELKSGYFDQATGARFVNGGTVVIAPPPSKGFVDKFGENGSGLFVNERGGVVRDPPGGAEFQLSVPFESSGEVDVSPGQSLTLLDGGSGAAGSRFSVAPRGTLDFGGGTFQLAKAAFAGAGTFDFQLGTVVLGGQKIANVAQCGTTVGPFTVTRSWVSAACISNGEAVLEDAGAATTTTFARGVKAKIAFGGYLVLAKRHRLVNMGTLVDQSDVCLAGGSVLTNDGTLQGIKSPTSATRSIHPNCGLPGAEGTLVNAPGGVVQGTTATITIYVPFTNLGHVRGKVTVQH
jgi:hypothetical protein